MPRLDPGYIDAREKAYNEQLDRDFSKLYGATWDLTGSEKPPEQKPTTAKQRMFKTGQQTLDDPNATRIEKFLAGASQEADRTMEYAFRRLDPKEFDPIGEMSKKVFSTVALPFSAVAQGLVEAGIITQDFVNDVFQGMIGALPALMGPEAAALRNMKSMRESNKLINRSVLEDSGVPVPEASPATESAVRNVQLESQLARLIAGKDTPKLEHAQAARALIEQNPGMGESDLIRKALGGLTESEAGVAAASTRAAKGPGEPPTPPAAPTIASEEPAATQEPVAGETPKTAPVEGQTEPIPVQAQLSPNAPGYVKAAWTGAPREVPTQEKPFSIVAPDQPTAEHLPGFKYPTTTGIAQELQRIHDDALNVELLDIQKRGVQGDPARFSAAADLIKTGKVTLETTAGLQPGTVLNAEQSTAHIAVANAAMNNAHRIMGEALQGRYDLGAAASIQAMADLAATNVSATSTEWGRVGRVYQEAGGMAGAQAITGMMPLDPSGGGMSDPLWQLPPNERIAALTTRLVSSAGGPKAYLEQRAMLETKMQRAALGNLQSRLGRATMELVYNSYMSIRTMGKIIRSGLLVTPTIHLAETAIAEGIGRVRPMLNAIAPHLIDSTASVVKGSAWVEASAWRSALQDAFRGLSKSWQATARVYKAELEKGTPKAFAWATAEQKWMGFLRENNPAWSRVMGKNQLRPAITSGQFPEVAELAGQGFANVIDVVAAVGRHNTDGVSASHAFTHTYNYRVGAKLAAHTEAVNAGLEPGTLAYEARVNELLTKLPSEIDTPAMTMANDNTFINQAHSKMLQKLQHLVGGQDVFTRVAVAPFTRMPINKIEYTLERTPMMQFLMRGWQEQLMNPKTRDLALAKGVLGTAIATTFIDLAAQGYTSGSPPSSKPERGAMHDAGIPYRAYWNPMTQKWNSAAEAEPLGDFITIYADALRISRDIKDPHFYDYMAPIAIASGHAFFDQGMLMGVSNWINVFHGEDENKTINAFWHAVQPPMPFQGDLQTLYPYADGLRREMRTFTDRYLAMLPGNSLPFDRNRVTGEPMEYEGAWPTDMLSAFQTRKMTNDPVLLEITRLRGAKIDKFPDHIGGPRPDPWVEMDRPGVTPGVDLTPWQIDKGILLQTQQIKMDGKTMHQAMTDLVTSERYRGLPDVEKATRLNHIYLVYQHAAITRLRNEDQELRDALRGVAKQKIESRRGVQSTSGVASLSR